MIIRLSVKDNDFQDKVSKYASKLFINIYEDGVENYDILPVTVSINL